MKFYTRYDLPPRDPLVPGTVSLTKQSFKDECDINLIVPKAIQNGTLQFLIAGDRQFADVSDAPQYHEAMNIVYRAQAQFDALSSKVRASFNNDPRYFMEFCSDAKNAPELVKLGLATAAVPPPSSTPSDSVSGKSRASKGASGSKVTPPEGPLEV